MKVTNEKHTGLPAQGAGLKRRDFLKFGGVGLAGLALVGSPVLLNAQAPVELVFAFGPDETGTLQKLIDAFNQQNQGRIRVQWREMAREADEYFAQMRSDLLAGAADIDVFAGDIIWTTELAYNGWIEDLSDRFYGVYRPDDFVGAALNTAFYSMRIWGVPWYTDAGMLFYRRDLLQASGFENPPSTWDELKSMAKKVQQDAGTRHGFVFQGGNYEGGVVNALEYIWGAGGRLMMGNLTFVPTFGVTPADVMDPTVITIDTPAAAQGLAVARSLIADGIAPEAVTEFREIEATQTFLAGDAVFMRNWPYVYGSLKDPQQSAITADQVGVAPIPISTSSRSYSCLGGWNLMINAASTKRDAAWEFIRFVTDPAQQKMRALEGGFLPTLRGLYDDPEIQQGMPVVVLGKEALANARARASSPFYSQMSSRISGAFNRVLKGELTGEEAVHRLAGELRTILRRNR